MLASRPKYAHLSVPAENGCVAILKLKSWDTRCDLSKNWWSTISLKSWGHRCRRITPLCNEHSFQSGSSVFISSFFRRKAYISFESTPSVLVNVTELAIAEQDALTNLSINTVGSPPTRSNTG